jgi:polysaccharide export outer membrane protein
MKKYTLPLILAILLASCASKKDVIYYQDIDDVQLQDVSDIKPKVKIELNDILQVDIKTLNPESTVPFVKQNVTAGGAGGNANNPDLMKLQGYIVNEYGEIDMPVIGKVQVEGLTVQQAEKKIKERLSGYLKDPYVAVMFLNFKFTVQGEVNVPGTYEVFDPNLTLLQALGRAGDLTIRGRRDNILIIRTIGEERIVRRIDLTRSDWMNSPFYFIKQNDLIYVEPNKPQVKTAGFIPDASAVISVISISITIILSFILTR